MIEQAQQAAAGQRNARRLAVKRRKPEPRQLSAAPARPSIFGSDKTPPRSVRSFIPLLPADYFCAGADQLALIVNKNEPKGVELAELYSRGQACLTDASSRSTFPPATSCPPISIRRRWPSRSGSSSSRTTSTSRSRAWSRSTAFRCASAGVEHGPGHRRTQEHNYGIASRRVGRVTRGGGSGETCSAARHQLCAGPGTTIEQLAQRADQASKSLAIALSASATPNERQSATAEVVRDEAAVGAGARERSVQRTFGAINRAVVRAGTARSGHRAGDSTHAPSWTIWPSTSISPTPAECSAAPAPLRHLSLRADADDAGRHAQPGSVRRRARQRTGDDRVGRLPPRWLAAQPDEHPREAERHRASADGRAAWTGRLPSSCET